MTNFNNEATIGYKTVNLDNLTLPELKDGDFANNINLFCEYREGCLQVLSTDDDVLVSVASSNHIKIGQRQGRITFRFGFDGDCRYEPDVYLSDFTAKQQEMLKGEMSKIAMDYMKQYPEIVTYNRNVYIQNEVNRALKDLAEVEDKLKEAKAKVKQLRKLQ
jgi:hypothetical protein